MQMQRLESLDERAEEAMVKQYPSPFDQVKAEIQSFNLKIPGRNFEKPFRGQISLRDWLQLREDLNFDENESRFPRFSYNTSTSTLIVEYSTTAVHESLVKFVERYIIKQTELDTITNDTVFQFSGKYEGSEGVPDLGIVEESDKHEHNLVWLLEVGFSETYEELKNDITFWLEGKPTLARVVLINITENPPYKRPLDFISDETYQRLGLPQTEMEIDQKDFSFDNEYGPVSYKGFQWTGEITEIYWEVWKLDQQGALTQVGTRESILPAIHSPQIRFNDFLSNPLGTPSKLINWDEFRTTKLKQAILLTAFGRFCKWKKERAKAMEADRVRDPDYEPSLPDSD
jgi:hypothetical protein